MHRRSEVPPHADVVAEAAERGRELLGGGRRLEPPHHVLAQARRPAGLLDAVVQPGGRVHPPVLDRRELREPRLRRPVARAAVGHDRVRRVTRAAEQAAEEALRRVRIAALLDEHVEHLPVLVDRDMFGDECPVRARGEARRPRGEPNDGYRGPPDDR